MHLFVGCKILLMAAASSSNSQRGSSNRKQTVIAVLIGAGWRAVRVPVATLWLNWQIRSRQWTLQTSLPDAPGPDGRVPSESRP